MFRKVIFRIHPAVGIAAGPVAPFMAVTGVLLTSEVQITRWLDNLMPVAAEGAALRVDLLAEAALAETGGTMTGAAQLAFLVLLVSGIYLRLPKIARRGVLRSRIPFRRDDPNTQARTFSWHHLSAFRAVLPIRLIVVSGAEISRVWAGNIVMKAVGADTTTCGGPGFGHGRGRAREAAVTLQRAVQQASVVSTGAVLRAGRARRPGACGEQPVRPHRHGDAEPSGRRATPGRC